MTDTLLQVVGTDQVLVVSDPAFSPTIIEVQAQGPVGPVGPSGAGINLVGTVATVGNLPGSSSSGTAYLVTANNHIYVWSA
jgi:hypothetical protein